MSKTRKSLNLWLLGVVLSSGAWAHNQAPATIRRSMEKAFTSLAASTPPNVFKGNRTLRVSGSTAQVFEVKKDAQITGFVVQLEYREQTHVVALDKASGEVKAVLRDGSALEQQEWKELPFIEPLRTTLLNGK